MIGSTIALFWEEPTTGCEADSFVIRVGSTAGASNVGQIDTGFATSSFSVAGVPAGVYYVRVHARIGSTIGPASNEAVVTVTGVPPPGTSVFVGLVANGDGVTITDPECGGGGVLRLDLRVTVVQTGSTINGVSTVTIRSAPNCPEGVGLTESQPVTGTVTGSLASGSGTITATIGSGSEMGLLNGTFANGRMTGTVAFPDGAAGTFAANRQ